MRDELVIDVEIQDAVAKEEDWDATDKMKISCCVMYSYPEDRYKVFGPNDLDYLRNTLIIAERVIGYNINKFDIPIIFGQRRGSSSLPKIRTYDILAEIWKAQGLDPTEFTSLHRNWGLDSVSSGTLLKGKQGSGKEAPYWWKMGDIWKVISYCINDVALTKEVYDHIKNNGLVTNRYGAQVKLSC